MTQLARQFAVTHLAACAADVMADECGHGMQTGRLEELAQLCEKQSARDPMGYAKSLVNAAAIEYSAIYAPSPYVPVKPND